MSKTMSYVVVVCAFLAHINIGGAAPQQDELVRYVDPNIGGVGHLLQPTLPLVHLPHSMVRLAPLRTPAVLDKYLATRVYEFPMTITSHRIAEAFALMPTSGPLSFSAEAVASEFDHDEETATPYYYSVLLETHNITEEHTPAQHCAYFRLEFNNAGDAHILFRSHKQGRLEVVDRSTVRGYEDDLNVRYYFYAKLSLPSDSYVAAIHDSMMPGLQVVEGQNTAIAVNYKLASPATIEVKVGISFISLDQAEANVDKELIPFTFDEVKSKARKIWNETLGKIRLEGGTEKQKRIFYTALYRTNERMVDISEDGRYYSPFDHQVHEDGGHPFYVDDWLWDTYRSLHALQLLVDPQMTDDFVRSYVRMYEQEGWVPAFPIVRGDHPCMIGNHAASFVTDAYLKGITDFDVEKAYEGLKKNAMEATMLPWANGPMTELDSIYLEKGFFPALAPGQKEWVKEVHPFERRQSVAVTLENCYDDWCLAQLAKALNKQSDYEYFMQRAHNYLNVYNTTTGFVSPKTADGKWIEPFDPKLSGGQGGRAYFAECNAWTYTWSVQHDVQGLINLMGGREKFIGRLNQMFNEGLNTDKFTFLGQFPDASGLSGQFAMGDEPSFHIPYLYNYAGAPWRAQRTVREMMDVWFDDDPLGICGDEDGGAMSSWYVLSAMGFYPVTPGMPVYTIGSPVFTKVSIVLGNGHEFVVEAKNASAKNKYIQSATLNGKPLTRTWFEHAQIAGGGNLTVVMGPRPNKEWGSKPEDAPPSMSKPIKP